MRGLAIFVASGGECLNGWVAMLVVSMQILENNSLPDVAKSDGPNACMFELLGLETSICPYSNGKTYRREASVCSKMA
jgi:hypothetical protein